MDGAWSDQELAQFQEFASESPLESDDIASLKSVASKAKEGVKDNKVGAL